MPFDAKDLGLYVALVTSSVLTLLFPPTRVMRYIHSAGAQLRGWDDPRFLAWLGFNFAFSAVVGVIVYRAYHGTTIVVGVGFVAAFPLLVAGIFALASYRHARSSNGS